MSSHKNISENRIGAEQESHQYFCRIYNVIKYLYSVNGIQYLFGSNYKYSVRSITSIMVSEQEDREAENKVR